MHYYIKRKYYHYIRNKKVISCKGSETKHLLSETEGSPMNPTDNCLITPELPITDQEASAPRTPAGLLRLKALSGKIMPFAPIPNKKHPGPSGLVHLGTRKKENKRTRRLKPGSLSYSLFIIPLLLLIFMFHLLLNCTVVSITE